MVVQSRAGPGALQRVGRSMPRGGGRGSPGSPRAGAIELGVVVTSVAPGRSGTLWDASIPARRCVQCVAAGGAAAALEVMVDIGARQRPNTGANQRGRASVSNSAGNGGASKRLGTRIRRSRRCLTRRRPDVLLSGESKTPVEVARARGIPRLVVGRQLDRSFTGRPRDGDLWRSTPGRRQDVWIPCGRLCPGPCSCSSSVPPARLPPTRKPSSTCE